MTNTSPHTHNNQPAQDIARSAPIPRVVGLQYSPEQGLPMVTVKGTGPLAEELLKSTLQTNGPRLVRDPVLLEKLYRLPIDSAIDFSLFQIVANVLTYVFSINEQMNQRGDSHG